MATKKNAATAARGRKAAETERTNLTGKVAKAPAKKKVKEERFVLVPVSSLLYERPGEEGESRGDALISGTYEQFTKGELLALLAEEISNEPLETRQGKSVPFKMPKEFGAIADLLYTTRRDRLEYQHKADAMKVHETAMKDYLINNLSKKDSTGAAGKLARAQIHLEATPMVENWDDFYKHIAKTKSFDLLNRAVNRAAVKARWDNGKVIPGVGKFDAVKVSVTKVGAK